MKQWFATTHLFRKKFSAGNQSDLRMRKETINKTLIGLTCPKIHCLKIMPSWKNNVILEFPYYKLSVSCFNPLPHNFRALYPLTQCNSWIPFYKLSVSCLKPVELVFFLRVRPIRRLLKFFIGLSSLVPCRYNKCNQPNCVSSPQSFCKRWNAKCARMSKCSARGKNSNPLRLLFHSRYGRWLYRKLKKTANALNIFSRTSQLRSHYFPFVW